MNPHSRHNSLFPSLRLAASAAFAVASAVLLLLVTAVTVTAATQPLIHKTSVTGVTTTCAVLHAEISPQEGNKEEPEAETTYHFEYGTTTAYGSSTPESASIGSSSNSKSVENEVCGLSAGTHYHFRAVATNSQSPPGGTLGPDVSFRSLYGSSHELSATFGATATAKDPYPLSEPSDVAVDQSNGDLYVTDPGNHRVEKFTPSGEFILMFGKEVDKTAVEKGKLEAEENVCTKASGNVCQPGTPGPMTECAGNAVDGETTCKDVTDIAAGQLDDPTFLAVDNAPGEGEGDVYVGDSATHLVEKFTPSGQVVTGWGEEGKGQKDGRDLTLYGSLSGVAVGPHGTLYVGGLDFADNWYEYTRNGVVIPPYHNLSSGPGLKTSPAGVLYGVGEGREGEGGEPGSHGAEAGVVIAKLHESEITGRQVTANELSTSGFDFDPLEADLYQDNGSQIYHYTAAGCEPLSKPCEPFDTFGAGQLSSAAGVAVDGDTHTVYVADSGDNEVAVFADIRPEATTGGIREVGETSLTLTGRADPESNGEGHGPIASCFFEYGFTTTYSSIAPCEQSTPYGSAEAVSARLEGLTPITDLPVGTVYHYRLVVSNQKGATKAGTDRTAVTTAAPRLEGIASSHLAATSAELDATVNPDGLPTKYLFEYGPTTAYGEATAEVEITGSEEELFEPHRVKIEIENLQRGVAYHFRAIAVNPLGTATSEDQSFEFFPPSCPNAAVRQQTSSAFLPDCRAYELVSPANAEGAILLPGGPNTGQATNPSRFAFIGDYSSLPGADTINTGGDLYVATRTDTGWVSHYIGLAGNEAGCMGGPPNDSSSYITANNPTELNQTVLGDSSLDRLLDWNDGEPFACVLGSNGVSGANLSDDPPSNAPYLWNADGTLVGRLPTGLETKPGALAALKCPYIPGSAAESRGACTGEVAASGNLEHFVFSSNSFDFSEGSQAGHGLTVAPGSAYDDDLATGKVSLISSLKGSGQPIPQDSAFAATPPVNNGRDVVEVPGGKEEFLRFPAISADGSHILISTATAGAGECWQKSTGSLPVCPRFLSTPVHLYMSIDDEGAVEVSKSELTGKNVAVNYVGMTEDGSKVFFTTAQSLVSEDEDTSADLYMWSQQGEESGHPLTLVSKADPGGEAGAGNSDSCAPPLVTTISEGPHGERIGSEVAVPWTAKCGVVPFSAYPYSVASGGFGGNGISDTGIASRSGDIYFYSPERLDGDHGVPNRANLYDYREGRLQFVATLDPQPHCIFTGFGEANLANKLCSAGPMVRVDVSPDDSHMAFLTATRLTSYDNAGHLEMYSYTPATGNLVCDSCNPTGKPAAADVAASEDGPFMTDDGRTFFSTAESLVPSDTNQGEDVYEFVDGRPRLISPGTGTATASSSSGLGSVDEIPGLIGVSANGTDVYFSTFDTLISQDQNGNFLRFYDARTSGGFAQPTPAQPCAAAEECHGPGTEAPRLPTQGTTAELSGGNAGAGKHAKRHGKRPKRRHAKKPTGRGHAHRRRGGAR